jgi:hypothetical protein
MDDCPLPRLRRVIPPPVIASANASVRNGQCRPAHQPHNPRELTFEIELTQPFGDLITYRV